MKQNHACLRRLDIFKERRNWVGYDLIQSTNCHSCRDGSFVNLKSADEIKYLMKLITHNKTIKVHVVASKGMPALTI